MNHRVGIGYGAQPGYPITAEIRGDIRRLIRDQVEAVGSETPYGAQLKVDAAKAVLETAIAEGDATTRLSAQRYTNERTSATLTAAQQYTDSAIRALPDPGTSPDPGTGPVPVNSDVWAGTRGQFEALSAPAPGRIYYILED